MTQDNEHHLGNSNVETLLTHHGREPDDQFGFVNTPVYRGSTVLFKTLADLEAQSQKFLYGRAGNPTSRQVEELITQLEGAHGTCLLPSGLAAITTALMSCLSAGDDVLITDNAYQPTRDFCVHYLAKMGVSVRFYDPRIGVAIEELFTDRTRAVFVESPGSGTFEVQNLPAIAKASKPRGIKVVVDNSWATPLFHRPLALGADIVVHSGTKMFSGHSDAFAGTVSATSECWPNVEKTRKLLGFYTSGDEAFLVARGLRTLALRMKEHQTRTLEVAQWLEQQTGVMRVLHPALPSHPDHAIFKRDFSGSGSLFGVVVQPGTRENLAAMVDNFRLFSMGYSWGGYESLCIPVWPHKIRTATQWNEAGTLLRFHIGFEAIEDLKSDIADGLARYLA